MKRIKTKKLVLTDGTWYFENNHYEGHENEKGEITQEHISTFVKNPKFAWDFHCDRFPELNSKKHLEWELNTWTKGTPHLVKTEDGYHHFKEEGGEKVKRENCKLKWVTIIETIKSEDFNFEGFNE